MSESPDDRARSVEAVRFARREACADVVAELEAALAACRAERDGERAEIVTLLDRNEHLAAERDAQTALAVSFKAQLDAALADTAVARGLEEALVFYANEERWTYWLMGDHTTAGRTFFRPDTKGQHGYEVAQKALDATGRAAGETT